MIKKREKKRKKERKRMSTECGVWHVILKAGLSVSYIEPRTAALSFQNFSQARALFLPQLVC